MAADDKTEKPTPKRRGEARKRGQIAKSHDLNGAVVLGAGFVALGVVGPAIVSVIGTQMTASFNAISDPGALVSVAGIPTLINIVVQTALKTIVPVAGICLAAGVLINVLQVGFRPSPRAIVPNFNKINPATGLKNLLGPRMIFETGKALAKISVIGGIVAIALLPDLTQLGAGVGTPPAVLAGMISANVAGIAERAVVAYVLIGIIDYVWQRRRTEKGLKMSKQEIKDETKNHQLPPEVRNAIRRRQMQMSRARMMAAIPNADVVVTNPTHYAVALSYDGQLPAPVVVAKGQDLVALQIRRIALEHDIPIVPDPPLARELHASVEIGQMIPVELYAAVAQVLAFVYRLAARRKRGA